MLHLIQGDSSQVWALQTRAVKLEGGPRAKQGPGGGMRSAPGGERPFRGLW